MDIWILVSGIFFVISVVLFQKQRIQSQNLEKLASELNTEVNIKQEQQIELAKLNQKTTYLSEELQKLENINTQYNNQIQEYSSTISQLKTQLHEQSISMKEKLELLQSNEKIMKNEFKNLANEIFDNNSKKLQEQNQLNLSNVLNPMKTQFTDFKKRFEDIYITETKDRSALINELKSLKELNQKMTQEALNLTNALKGDSKKQGIWGEMVLENVLESSGLREGYEYHREVSIKDEQNKIFRPDVIVKLPNNRDIIIDAKTSLTAYNEYMSSNDEQSKSFYLKNHIKSIKDHIKELSNKKYEDLPNINSLDFIFMFIPIEGALLLALENDLSLYDDAFKQKIILVSPTTLLVALRAVENSWRYEKQAKNIQDVYKRAEELYKKFDGFIEDLKKVGKSIETANTTYNEAFKKLSTGRGNLISQVTMLKKVSNIKPKKEIDSKLVDEALDED
jgi:DNA recombination protein RmuC